MTYLDIKDLEVTIANAKILKEINLTVEKGDFIGLIGPNGSGKSTLLKSIYRNITPTKGVVYLDGTALHKMPFKESAKKMSVVGQHNEHAFEFNVFELVMMGRTPHKGFMERDSSADKAIAMRALEQVSMTSYAHRNYSTLSGGEKQRVILARALAQEPALLILDEPTNHLDVKHQLEIMNVVNQLDTTVIFAVHDLNIALMYCNKVCILNEGKVVDVGAPKELITPKMIKEIYGVHAEVIERSKERLHVIYEL